MRSWDELAAYVRAHYQFEEPGEGYIFLVTADGQGTPSAVFLARIQHPQGGFWVEMTAPVGNINEIDLGTAAQKIGGHPCGGISVGIGMVLVRLTCPINSMSESDFEVLRTSIIGAARRLAVDARR